VTRHKRREIMKKKNIYIISACVLVLVLLLLALFLFSKCTHQEAVISDQEETTEYIEEEITENTEEHEIDIEETASSVPTDEQIQELFMRIDGYWYYEGDNYDGHVFRFYEENGTYFMEYLPEAYADGFNGLVEFTVINETQDYAEAMYYATDYMLEETQEDALLVIDTGVFGDNMMSITYTQYYLTDHEEVISAPDCVHYDSMSEIYGY
jgi:Ca2+/Na+ antiporter